MRDPSEGRATLALETGHCFSGRLIGAHLGESVAIGRPHQHGTLDPSPPLRGGEVVFHTGMTGYQEILTDPSYRGQIVVFTAPHIGNYGIHADEDESRLVHPTGVIVRDLCRRSFHQRSESTLEDVLRRSGVPGLSEVDTRALTNVLREQGSCRGVIGVGPSAELVERARALAHLSDQDPVQQVSTPQAWAAAAESALPADGSPLRVAVLDFGVKKSILSQLTRRGCELRVLPAASSLESVESCFEGASPEGFFLSNGPGDPARLPEAVAHIARLADTGRPIFGICLGHQLLGRALGGRTYKLPFGHHGANHPVQCLHDRRVAITSHNHNYAVQAESLDPKRVRITHRSLNDGCVEGMELIGRPIYSVQYHPEAAPGPRDGEALFDRFRAELLGARVAGNSASPRQAEGA
jgi:carbamoyl-phosphate synthase small subunit